MSNQSEEWKTLQIRRPSDATAAILALTERGDDERRTAL